MGEVWREVRGYEGRYEVSSLGRVRSLRIRNRQVDMDRKIPKVLAQYEGSKKGYRRVCLSLNGLARNHSVHRLVLEAFAGPCPDGMETCHLNGDPSDNRSSNLRWGSSAENEQMKREHGTFAVGEQRPAAKLRERDIPTIRKRLQRGDLQQAVADDYGVSHQAIFDISTRKTWKHLNPQKGESDDQAD